MRDFHSFHHVMGKEKALTDFERKRTHQLYEAGFAIRDKDPQVKRSPAAVRRELSDVPAKRPTGGRPVLTERALRQLVRVAAGGNHSAPHLNQ